MDKSSIDELSLQKAVRLFESGDFEQLDFKGIEQSYYYEGYKKEG